VLVWEFVEQLASFRVHNAATTTDTLQALNRFGAFFCGDLRESYLKHQLSQR
jgi:hypothetical protein